MRANKPRVKTRCVANRYAAPNERIIEFGAGSAGEGGLISFLWFPDTGDLIVAPYRLSKGVTVRVGTAAGVRDFVIATEVGENV